MALTRTGALLGKKFNEYLFPTIISSMSVLLASFVDGIIVSKLISDDAFSAINLAEPIVLFMQALFFLFGIGGAISISVAKGRRDERKANTLFTLSFAATVLTALVVTAAGVLLIDPITSLLCNDAQLYDYVKHYALFNLIGSVFMITAPYLVYIMRVDGMPKLSANILLVSNAVNLVMDFVYIGVFKMDTAGAALATVTGYVVGFLMELYYLFFFKKRTLRFVKLKKEELRYFGRLCTGGIASVTNTILFFVRAILVNRIVLSTGGSDAIAVFSVCNFTVTFISMFVSGGADTMTPIVSLLYGEQDHKGINIILRKTFAFVGASCAVIIGLIAAFPQLLLRLFSVTSPERVAMGVPAVRIFSLSFIGMSICFIMMNYLQATDHKALSVMVTILRGLVITVPAAYGLSLLFGVTGVWWSFVISELFTAAVIFFVCFVISRIRSDKYTGVFLHERQTGTEALYDVSLKPEAVQASAVAHEIVAFCLEHGIESDRAKLAGVLAEETVENLRRHNNDKKPTCIDLICRVTDSEIILSVRDDGETFDSITVDEDCDELTNLKMIRSIADKVSYTRALGLNNMLIVLGKNES